MAITAQRPAAATRRCSASRRSSCSSAPTSSTSSPSGCAGGSAIPRRSRRSTCAAGRRSSPSPIGGIPAAHERASSAPLAGAWDGVGDGLISCRARSRGSCRPAATACRSASTSARRRRARPAAGTRTTASRPDDPARPDRRAGRTTGARTPTTRSTLNGWKTSDSADGRAAAGRGPLLAGHADDVEPRTSPQLLTFTVTPARYHGPTDPLAADAGPARPDGDRPAASVTVRLHRDASSATANGPYTVTALMPIDGNEPGELNQETLRAAGTTYPDEITDLYLDVPDGALRPAASPRP